MTNEERHQAYLAQMKDMGASKPYMDFKQWKVAFNIKDDEEIIPIFIARKSSSHKQVKPTLQNHEKKCKAPKKNRLLWSKKAVA